MYREITRAEQPAATFEAVSALTDRQTDLASGPPRTGDVFLSRRTADFPVEWLVVDEEDGRIRVMPVDDHPFVGSRDLELSSESLGGAGVLRCDLDAWLDTSELEPELRTATLSATELDNVRRKRRALDEEEPLPSLLEDEVDGDPIYQRWRDDTLAAAVAALTGAVESTDAAEPIRAAAGGWRWRPILLAASVLLVALPAGWWLYQLNDQLTAEKARIAELEQDRQALENELAAAETDRQAAADEVTVLEATIQEVRETAERVLAEQKARLDARLRRAFDEAVVVNVPFFSLGKEARTRSVRGQAVVLDPGDAQRMTLSLEIVDPAPYPLGYRIEIVAKDNGEMVWSNDELVPARGKWLRLDFPTSLFEAEEYEILLYGLKEDSAQLLTERYVVELEL